MRKLFTLPVLLILFVITVSAFAVNKFDIIQFNAARFQADNGQKWITMEAPTTLAANTTQTLTVGTGHVGLVIGTPVSGHLATYNATVGQLVDGGAIGATCPGTATNGQVLYDNAGVCGGITNATSSGTTIAFTGTVVTTGGNTTGPDWEVGITGDTVNRVAVGLNTVDTPRLSFGPGGASVRDAFLEYQGAANMRLGGPASATPVAQIFSVQNAVGTDIAAAASWTFVGPLSTGTGTNGDFIFQTGVKNVSGTTAGTKTTGFTLKGETQAALFVNLNAAGTGTTAGFNVLNNSLTTGNGVDVSSTSVTTGNVAKFSSTSTAAGSNTQTVLNVSTSGANGTTTQTTFGGLFSNTHSGTGSTNVAATFAASGGATANIAVQVTAGATRVPDATGYSFNTATTSGITYSSGLILTDANTGMLYAQVSGNFIETRSSAFFGWSNGAIGGTFDTGLERLTSAGQIAANNGSTCGTLANCRDIASRHGLATGTACTIGSGFGSGAAFVDGGCRDDSFRIGVGTTPGTTGVVAFGTAYTNKPACTAMDESTSVLLQAVATTTQVTINGVFVNNDVIAVVCRGRV